MIHFWCQCGRQLQAGANMIGKPASCPLCRRITIVPTTDQTRAPDFPPVPPKARVNEYGEVKRAALDPPPVPREPTYPDRPRPRPRRAEPTPRPFSGWATASVILGALSFPCLMGLLTAIPAIVTGIVALRDRRVRAGEMSGKGGAIAGIVLGCLGVLILVPLFFATLKVREAAARQREASYLKQIGVAMHNHHDTMGYCPAATAYRTKDGKPGLSWRVALLPYIEQGALYNQFNLDEPWDSPNNIRLLSLMPVQYLQPGQANDGSGMTHYQVFVGPGSAFEDLSKKHGINPFVLPGTPQRGLTITSFTDGTSNTIMVAVAKNPVPWTKPDDLSYDPTLPLPLLDDRHGGVNFLMGDGSVRFERKDIPATTLRALITRNGGEIINWP
jgi:prepilin-type processing-associated H-X9-DG protein